MTSYTFTINRAVVLALVRTAALVPLLLTTCIGGQPKRVVPEIVRTIPHATTSFTQGLLFYDGVLYETTGRYGHSSFRQIDPSDGRVIKIIPVAGRYFAEGLALLGDIFVHLTWRSQIAFTYDRNDMAPRGSFAYEGQGWGLTTMDGVFVMSNGSDTLYIRDRTFQTIGRMAVTIKGTPRDKLNELEFARGRIYANVWYSTDIMEIDPSSGKVSRIIDCRLLAQEVGPLGKEDVLNGIAFDESSGAFYLTGKNWPKIFEVRIPPQ